MDLLTLLWRFMSARGEQPNGSFACAGNGYE